MFDLNYSALICVGVTLYGSYKTSHSLFIKEDHHMVQLRTRIPPTKPTVANDELVPPDWLAKHQLVVAPRRPRRSDARRHRRWPFSTAVSRSKRHSSHCEVPCLPADPAHLPAAISSSLAQAQLHAAATMAAAPCCAGRPLAVGVQYVCAAERDGRRPSRRDPCARRRVCGGRRRRDRLPALGEVRRAQGSRRGTQLHALAAVAPRGARAGGRGRERRDAGGAAALPRVGVTRRAAARRGDEAGRRRAARHPADVLRVRRLGGPAVPAQGGVRGRRRCRLRRRRGIRGLRVTGAS